MMPQEMNEAELKAWCQKHQRKLKKILAMAHPLKDELHNQGAEMVALILTNDEHGAFITPVNVGGARAIEMANQGLSRMETEAFVNVSILIHYAEGLQALAELKERAIEIQRTCTSYTGYFKDGGADDD
jgi:hypothetical protein